MEPTPNEQPADISPEVNPTQPVQNGPNKDKMSKKQIIGMAILVLIAIAGVAFGVFGITDSNSKNQEITDYKNQIELLKKETGVEIIEKDDTVTVSTESMKDPDGKVKSIATEIAKALSNGGLLSSPVKTFGEGGVIRLSGTEIMTISNKFYGVYVDNKNLDNNVYTIVQSALTSEGYKKVEELMAQDLYYNENEKIYCVADNTDNSIGLSYMVECSSEKWISDEDKALILDLSKASEQKFISASVSMIKDSTISPYQRLNASIAGAVGLFYRVSPDSEWVFFKGTQAALSCSEYTGDAAKAFAGDTCWDESTNNPDATVNP